MVSYYSCKNCCFLQTEAPYWLEESYSSAITSLDIGLLERNIELSNIISAIIHFYFKKDAKFIDFAGGYGMLVRLLRDKGFDYFRQDKYCENLFAEHFDISSLSENIKFELLTAFEVFEHLDNPMETIEEMFNYSDNILFSTRLIPKNTGNLKDWWYISPQIGQHISFYHLKSLQEIASLKKLHLYSNKRNIHLLTKNKLNPLLFNLITRTNVAKVIDLLFNNHKKQLKHQDYKKLERILQLK